MNESSNIQDMPDNTSDLRQAWKNACLRIDSLQTNVDKTVMALRKRNIDSSLQRLRRIFSRQIRLACLCIVTIPLTVYPVSHGNIWLSVAMGLFFIIMATSIYMLRRRLDTVDCSRSKIVDSLKAVSSVEIGLKRHTIVGASLGLPILLWFFSAIGFNELPMLIGGCLGAVAGVAIGLNIRNSIKRSLAELRADLDA